MKVGFIGLGNMGAGLAQRAISQGLTVVGYNRSKAKTDALKQTGFIATYSLEELVKKLEKPRILWLMLEVGQPIESALLGTSESPGLIKLLQAGDIIVDGANSFYQDSQCRAQQFQTKKIHYLDCGTSGGIEGALTGASLMIGGEKAAFSQAEPLFKALAAPDGYGYFGPSGSGHFVKMVHNGIEYGMLQAIAEGMAILEASDFKPDLAQAARVWSHGSIIQSNLIQWLQQLLEQQPNLNQVEAMIGSLGTGKWTAQVAMELGIPAPVISAAVNARYESRPESGFSRKVVQALREHFGGHNTQERDAKK